MYEGGITCKLAIYIEIDSMNVSNKTLLEYITYYSG